jgi:hypothetical protein
MEHRLQTAIKLSQSLDIGRLIIAGLGLLRIDKGELESPIGKARLVKIMHVVHALLGIVLSEAQMREFLVCHPAKSSREQAAFSEVVFSFLPHLESLGVIPPNTATLKSDLADPKGWLPLLRYLVEGLLLRENARRHGARTISVCNYLKDIHSFFRTPAYAVKPPEECHYWIGAMTKSAHIVKQRNIERSSLSSALVSVCVQSSIAEYK